MSYIAKGEQRTFPRQIIWTFAFLVVILGPRAASAQFIDLMDGCSIGQQTWPKDGACVARAAADQQQYLGVCHGTPACNVNGLTLYLNEVCHCPQPLPGPGPSEFCPTCGDPIDTATGLFTYSHTDLRLPDVEPIHLDHTYRELDTQPRAFGTGTVTNYDLEFTLNADGTATLILPSGRRILYQRTNPRDSYSTMCGAAYTTTSSPDIFYGSHVFFLGTALTQFNPTPCEGVGGWIMSLKDGTSMYFGHGSLLTSITDRNGNTVWAIRNPATLNVSSVYSTDGRWINLNYGSNGYVSSAQDSAGRTVSYVYNSSGDLTEFHDANGGVTQYGYDSAYRMATVTTPKGYVHANNQFDSNNRVIAQVQPDGGVWHFAYLLDGYGNVTETDMTDPRGYLHGLTFDSNGYSLSDTWAVGQPEQQTFSFNRSSTTELVNSVTDALNRTTAFTYDSLANILSVTRLSGTSNASTTSFTYGVNSQLASVTDPLNHTWTIGLDGLGNATSVTDPLGHATAATYNGFGQVKTVTDPLSHTTTFGYAAGILSSVTDPLSATTYMVSDSAGRTIQSTDPLNNVTSYSYDPLDRLTGIIDANGGTTVFSYDPDSNLTSVADANSNQTTYTYDSMDRRATRKDALLATESYAHDYNGNVTQATDRRGKVTKYQYDGLNRRTFAGFGWNGTGYESTINYGYDGGNRLTSAVDSIAGTITRQYDDLDNPKQEVTPLGTVNYQYDSASRRYTMQVAGQSQVSYNFDNANRLSGLTQGSQSVGSNYDSANRRSCLTLPNGVIQSYGYDSDSRITSITYGTGGSCTSPPSNLGNLTYTYDAAGRRLSMGGSLATVTLPANVAGGSSTTYNADNEQVIFNGTSQTFDANGNLTNDGTNTYNWDARNHLIATSGGSSASFVYDGVGRRQEKVINSTTTQFLYDGLNPLQELDGASTPNVTANLLTGLDIDEYFTRTASSATSTFLRDGLGSTVGLVGSAGTIATSYTYQPFGATTISGAANSNSYQFTGRENDSNGLNFHRARYYSPTDQRFSAQDPIDSRGGVNLYEYTFDNPGNLIDPLGLDAYICNRPLWPSPLEAGPLYHQYICIVEGNLSYCFGLGPAQHNWFDSPGTWELDKPNKSCQKKSAGNCVDDCLLKRAFDSAPRYSVTHSDGGTECQSFSDSAIEYCEAQCAADSWASKGEPIL